MEVIVTQAWKLLETIRRNRENWVFSEIRHLQMGSKMVFSSCMQVVLHTFN
jgi:hypothetical protein